MAKITPPPELREYLRKIGSKGGKRRLTTMTEEQRRELARHAGLKSAEARAKKKAKKQRTPGQ